MSTTIKGLDRRYASNNSVSSAFDSRRVSIINELISYPCKNNSKSKTRKRVFGHAATEKKFYHIFSDIFSFTLSVCLSLAFVLFLKEHLLTNSPQLQLSNMLAECAIMFLVPLSIIIVCSYQKGHYTRFKGFWEEYGEFLKFSITAALLSTTLLFFSQSSFSRLWLLSSWPLILTLIPISRWATKHYLKSKDKWFTPTIVIGSGKNALESALAIESNVLMGFKVVGLLDLNQSESTLQESKVRIFDRFSLREREFQLLSPTKKLEDLLRDIDHPYIVLALEPSDYSKHQAILEDLAATRNNMSIIPPLRGLPLLGMEISVIFRHEVPVLRIRNNLANRFPRLLKRLFDIVVSGLALILLSPLLLFIYLRVKKDGGPAFYAQKRVSKNGLNFNCWKFRSMHVDAENLLQDLLDSDPELKKEYEETEKLKVDPRITPFGAFIRRTSLDELPQLWNVFKGEMSLVGPRPVKEAELKRYGSSAKYYLDTPPGITGLWQVSGRNDVEYSTRVNLDAWYVRNWSLWYDITILMKTIRVVFKNDGAY